MRTNDIVMAMRIADMTEKLVDKAEEAREQGLNPYNSLCKLFGLNPFLTRLRIGNNLDTLIENLVKAAYKKKYQPR